MSDSLLTSIPLLERRALTSVRFGRLYHSPNQIAGHIRKAAQVLVHIFPEERHELVLRGTATSLHYRDRFFVISTRHQVDELQMEFTGNLAELPNRYITSEKCSWLGSIDELKESDQYDLYAWEFTAPVKQGKLSSSNFLPLLEAEFLEDGDEVIGAHVYGYRTADQVIDWTDDGTLGPRMSHIHVPQQEVFCEYHGDGYEDTIARLVAANDQLADADGLSGSPAFLYVREASGFSCKFAGVVVRGGNRNLYVVKHTLIRKLLDRVIGAESDR